MNAWGSQCQPDVRKLFHTVLPFGCILAGPFPAEERHRETRLGARGEGGGECKLIHYLAVRRGLVRLGVPSMGTCAQQKTPAGERWCERVIRWRGVSVQLHQNFLNSFV